MKNWLRIFPFCLTLCASAQQQPGTDRLPVTRVVLFKSGVGYFEHQGKVRGNEEVAISFSSSQLNDALKSLTVLDLNGGRIAGVSYGSDTPVDRQLGNLRLSVSERTTLGEFLNALRGARIELRSGSTTLAGRLLSVERKMRTSAGITQDTESVTLITDAGEMRSMELSPAVSVKLIEAGLAGKVDRFLDLVSKGREPDLRRMVVSATGTGERSLFVSYVSEAPVWKTTYRIVLGGLGDNKPLLQGWAIVDNTVGQDWENVSLSLVAGAPQSFIQNLSQPLYARRPEVALPQSINLAPQTQESTLSMGLAQLAGVVSDASGATIAGANVRALDARGGIIAATRTDLAGNYQFQGLPDGPLRLEFDSPGFNSARIGGLIASSTNPQRRDATLQVGSTTETVEVTATAPGIETSSAARSGRALGNGRALGGNAPSRPVMGMAGSGGGVGGGTYATSNARAALQSAALAQSLGDAFEYKLKEPITIRRNQSALVPIAQAPISTEKVSIWNEAAGMPLPQRALWLDNTTGLTLDGGSFTVLEQETFAGEGIFDPIRPAEKRLITYATDLALNVSSRAGGDIQAVTRIRIAKGTMTQSRELQEKKVYTFRNQDTTPRTVIVEHPVRAGYDLRGAAKPVETTATQMRFRLAIEPKQTATLTVEEARPLDQTYTLTNLNRDQLAIFIREKSINRTIEESLRKVLAQQDVISDLQSKIDENESEKDTIFNDQQRLRENMKALKGSVEEKALLQRYTRQLNEQETRLEALHREATSLEAQQAKEKAALDAYIEGLSLDVKI